LTNALQQGNPVLCVFILDENIINHLPENDARLTFIFQLLTEINRQLKAFNASLYCVRGQVLDAFKLLTDTLPIKNVFCNEDYEPYAIKRDREIEAFLAQKNIGFQSYKDQVIFAKNDILKADGKPYTVYTPYKNKWMAEFNFQDFQPVHLPQNPSFYHCKEHSFQNDMSHYGLVQSDIKVKDFDLNVVPKYDETRNFPAIAGTSNLGPHLRFGSISVRTIIDQLKIIDHSFVQELVWREFFMQILYHFPDTVHQNFKRKYDGIEWRNNETEFKKWCDGNTGYPLVDAGMRELNQTGCMHNRVRMITASFLCKHLLIDWRWGEAYFAKKLLDYEMSSNIGNWQWAAGTGCDAAPYFRVFNPSTQLTKFDKQMEYIKRWIPELLNGNYPSPMVDHAFARNRALDIYKQGLNK
jgi:deoxyribodipyrimidine photo-lyase